MSDHNDARPQSRCEKSDQVIDMSNDEAGNPVAETAELAASAETHVENSDGKKEPEPVKKSCSPGLTAWMKRTRLSIAFTSYQSGRMYLLG